MKMAIRENEDNEEKPNFSPGRLVGRFHCLLSRLIQNRASESIGKPPGREIIFDSCKAKSFQSRQSLDALRVVSLCVYICVHGY